MKAREFWIYDIKEDPIYEDDWGTVISTKPIKKHIHVREIIPADFKLFWEKFKGGTINREITREQKEVIEELIVRLIRGDL